MSAIFKNKKKDTETFLKLSDYERQIRSLNRQLIKYQKGFHKLTRYNDSSDIIIYNRYVDSHFWVISVKYDWNCQNRKLKFELRDMLDNRAVDYFQGQLWMKFLYSDEGKLKGFWISEFQTKIKNKGYGSMLLGEALWYIAQTFGTSLELRGWLSFVDEQDPENHKRRDHIYQKFGFEIDGEYFCLKGLSLDKIIEKRAKWHHKSSS